MAHIVVSIKSRLVAGFSFIALPIAGVGAFDYYGLSTLGDRIETMYESNTARIVDVSAIRTFALRIRMNLWRAQVEMTPQATARAEKEIAASRATIEQAWDRYYPKDITSPTERELAAQIDVALRKLLPENDKVIAMLRAENYEGAKE